MNHKTKKLCGLTLVALLLAAVPAYATVSGAFPRIKVGSGTQPISGGGVVAGTSFHTRSAVVVWNRRWNTLSLYLFWRPSVTCDTYRKTVSMPGSVIQVYVTNKPQIDVGPVAGPEVTFMTYYRDAKRAPHIAGLKEGAQLTFTRVNSYPDGVWHGLFSVPRRMYANGLTYGYDGTFAARWCEIRR